MSIEVLKEIVAGRMTGVPPWNVQQFEKLLQHRLLDPEIHWELLDGYVVRKNRAETGADLTTVGVRHCYVTNAIAGKLQLMCDKAGWSVWSQSPLLVNNYTQPEPDIAVIRGRGVDYAPNLPGSEAVLLLIEVADSSLEIDPGEKA